MYELNGRAAGGSGHPMGRFGDLELLIDARRSVGVEGRLLARVQDLSPHGTNYLDVPQVVPPQGVQGKAGAFGGYMGLRIADGYTGQGAPSRDLLPRGIVGPMTTVAVLALHNPTVNCVYDWQGDAGGLRALFAFNSGSGNWSMTGTGSIAGGAQSAEEVSIFTCVWNGAASSLRKNGVVIASGDCGAHALRSIRVGSVFSSGADMNGLLGLLAIYRGAFDPAGAAALERFVDRDWNLRLGL